MLAFQEWSALHMVFNTTGGPSFYLIQYEPLQFLNCTFFACLFDLYRTILQCQTFVDRIVPLRSLISNQMSLLHSRQTLSKNTLKGLPIQVKWTSPKCKFKFTLIELRARIIGATDSSNHMARWAPQVEFKRPLYWSIQLHGQVDKEKLKNVDLKLKVKGGLQYK